MKLYPDINSVGFFAHKFGEEESEELSFKLVWSKMCSHFLESEYAAAAAR